jgi:formate hydrogenlyase subunit 4
VIGLRGGGVSGIELAPAEIQVLQDLTILVFAPFLSGAIAHIGARLQGRRGPRILQPYYDIAKLFRKETLVPEDASWVFLACPVVAFACYLTVPLLIPVLTSYPLPLGYTGDILGGGFILALAGFSVAVGAAETGGPYAQLGSSRAMTLADTGRIPVETHASTLEFGMIDEARTLEHSGTPLALLKWGSAMKQMILYVILINVFVAPWGLAASRHLGAVLLAIPAFLLKALGIGAIFALVDNSFSKLRLFKITEFMAAAFLLAVLAVLVLYLGGR